MADPTQEIALVTGAGSGLGAVIAECLAAEGLTVAVNTRAHAEHADAVAAAIRAGGGCAFPVIANVTDPSAVRRMFDTVAAHGRLRVLVNNASYRPRQRVETITEDDWHQVRPSRWTEHSGASGTPCPHSSRAAASSTSSVATRSPAIRSGCISRRPSTACSG